MCYSVMGSNKKLHVCLANDFAQRTGRTDRSANWRLLAQRFYESSGIEQVFGYGSWDNGMHLSS